MSAFRVFALAVVAVAVGLLLFAEQTGERPSTLIRSALHSVLATAADWTAPQPESPGKDPPRESPPRESPPVAVAPKVPVAENPPPEPTKPPAETVAPQPPPPPPPCPAVPELRLDKKPTRPGAQPLSIEQPEEMAWINAEAKRAKVSGFCVMADAAAIQESGVCGPGARACYIGRIGGPGVIVLPEDSSLVLILHEIAHALDADYSPDCPHRHGEAYQKVFKELGIRFDRRFPGRRMENAVLYEVGRRKPDYYKCKRGPNQ